MDTSEKILNLMEGLGKSSHTIKLIKNSTLTANVRVVQFANGPKLHFTVEDDDHIRYDLHSIDGLLKSDDGKFKLSMNRFYFSLLREVNSEIRRLSDLIDNTL